MMGFLLQFVHCAVVKCSDVLDEHTVSIFTVTKFIQVDVDLIWRSRCFSHIAQFVVGIWSVTDMEDGKRYLQNT